jgi:hypothetical protein
MSDRTRFADRLVAVDPLSDTSRQHLEKELRTMFVRELGRTRRFFFSGVSVFGLISGGVCGTLAATEPQLPPLARGGLAVGVLFGLAWATVAGRIAWRGKLDLRTDNRRIAAMVWVFTTLMMTFFLMLGMSVPDRLLGLMMIANGLVFFIGAGVYLITSRIEQAELNNQERLLKLELRIAEWSEGQSGV